MTVASIAPRACRTCHYFQRSEEVEGQGECRKNPPTVFLTVAVSKVGPPRPVPTAAFPPVHVQHWCGAWEDARSIN